MSQYSNPTAEDIGTILEQFNDHHELTYKLLRGGSQNTNYRIDTESNSYVLTICEEKTIEETKQLVYLLEHLSNHGFPTSKVIRTKDGLPISIWNNKPIMLKAYLDGQIMNHLPDHLLKICGNRLAQLHRIPSPDYLPTDLSFGVNRFKEVALYAPGSEFHNWLKEITVLVLEHLSPDLPKSLIHSDVFFSNVIVHPDESNATIMDFEEASYYYRIFDIGMMMVGLCSYDTTLNLQKAACILTGYRTEASLLTIEKESLQVFTVYAAAATSFWRHKQFNYTKYDELQKDRYIEMRDVAEYVRNLTAEAFGKIFK